MINELLFFTQIILLSTSAILLALFGKEALTAYVSLLFIMANIFVTKQIVLFGYTVTSADAFIIGVSLSINILQEFWSKQDAKKAVYTSFALSLLYLIIGQCIVAYTPAHVDSAQIHLAWIMQHLTRIIIASFIAYGVTQMIDIAIYGYLKNLTKGKYFAARNYFSLCSSQLIDTILFSFLGLWGDVASISDIIIISYGIKLIAIFCMSPLLLVAKRIISNYKILQNN